MHIYIHTTHIHNFYQVRALQTWENGTPDFQPHVFAGPSCHDRRPFHGRGVRLRSVLRVECELMPLILIHGESSTWGGWNEQCVDRLFKILQGSPILRIPPSSQAPDKMT